MCSQQTLGRPWERPCHPENIAGEQALLSLKLCEALPAHRKHFRVTTHPPGAAHPHPTEQGIYVQSSSRESEIPPDSKTGRELDTHMYPGGQWNGWLVKGRLSVSSL